jgi:transglutaminase-like putative cysteine protease
VSLLGLAAVVVLAVSGLALAGVLRLEPDDGGLSLAVGSPDRTLSRVRLDLREGLIADACLLCLVLVTALLVAGSSWVSGGGVLVPMLATATVFCLVVAKVAPRGTTYWLAAEVAAVVALFVFTAPHVSSPPADFVTWVLSVRASVGSAALVTLAGAGWMIVAWAVYWVARRRIATIALAPLATVLAVEIINDPTQPASGELTVFWILLAAVLLLRMHTARIRERWQDMADAQVWIFIASRGAILVVVLLVVAVILPPLNTVDLSVALFHGRDPSQGQGPPDGPQTPGGSRPGSFLTTGYSDHVTPGGTLVRSATPVMQVSSDFTRPVYWRGINLYALANGTWSRGEAGRVSATVGPNTALDDGASISRQSVHATVQVLGSTQQTIFWPGEPFKADRAAVLRSNRQGVLGGVGSVEAAYAVDPLAPGTSYSVEATDSTASEDELRRATIAYPAAILRLAGLAPTGQPQPGTAISGDIAALATRVAGTGAVYDQVKNIETYLRTQERYQLKVTAPPSGTDPVAFFLFTSHVGYCEYFASSMGQMVRSLGIPVRLVSGYGPGQTTPKQDVDRQFKHSVDIGASVSTVRASDAHTWVEVYFPAYGWVPFEPTPDPLYPALSRGAGVTSPAVAPGTVPVVPVVPPQAQAPQHSPAASPIPALVGIGLAVFAAALLALILSRIARGPALAEDVGLAWRRLGWLGRRLGVRRKDSDTPLEFSSRLAARLPELEPQIMTIGRAYSRELYGTGSAQPADTGPGEAWPAVRRRMVRLLTAGAPAPQS